MRASARTTMEELERDPHDSEWAEAVDQPAVNIRRLHIGRQRKKMVQPNLRRCLNCEKNT